MKGKFKQSVSLEDVRVPEDLLELKGWNVPFVNNVRYPGAITSE
jgi:hypothetical protein